MTVRVKYPILDGITDRHLRATVVMILGCDIGCEVKFDGNTLVVHNDFIRVSYLLFRTTMVPSPA